ncbi:MAG: N-acetyltransferase [Actinobacteria bacterium]|nr:N-acetyltransferase [Actinomycetota bacterium]
MAPEWHDQKNEGWGLWAIRDAASGAFIGQGGLQRITELQDADVEFSVIIGRRNWRTGIATEAANAILYDAWGRLSGSQIHALVHPDSAAGGPFLRRIGFRRDDDQLVRGETLEVWHTQRLG